LVRKEILWGASKRKLIDGERIRGRTKNIVNKDLRGKLNLREDKACMHILIINKE
jgi:hypothetical protein